MTTTTDQTITPDPVPGPGRDQADGGDPGDLTPAERRSVQRKARTAGVLYLIIFLAGPFAFMLGRTSPVVPGDAATTAANIVESETMFRVGMVAETIVFGVEIVLAAILYVLLRPVSRSISLAAAFARFGEAVVQAVNLVTGGIVLALLSGAGYLAAFETEQLDALAMLFVDMNGFLVMVWGLLFGFHLAMLGWLVHRSGFWPRILGALLMVASAGYLAQSYGHLVAPRFDDTLDIVVQVLAIPAELAFTVWLLWKGIDTERWARRHRDAAQL
jgi:hypothetical protein